MLAVVLAAGKGSRMGGPKALMEVGGRPWWVTQCERLARAGVVGVWVVSPAVREGMSKGGGGVERGAMPRCVMGDAEAPMFASVQAGLREVERIEGGAVARGVFVLPVDVPAASADVWWTLGQCRTAARPAFGGQHGHPVYLPREVARRVMAAPASLRLDELIAEELATIDVSDADVAVNLNEPGAVARWLERSRGAGVSRD